MMPRKFDRIVEECLDRMDRGESLSQILAAYPGLEDQLEPLVLVAMLGRALPPPVPSFTALRLGKNDMLAEMAMMSAEGAFLERGPQAPSRRPLLERWGESLGRLQPAYRFAMLSVVVILAGGFFTLSASASELTNQVIRSLFYSFDQVGEMLWVNPDPMQHLGGGIFTSGGQYFPNQPENSAGGYKPSVFETGQEGEDGLPGIGDLDDQPAKPTPFDFEDEDLDLDQDLDLDEDEDLDLDKDEEKEEDKEDKDEEKDLKDEEKEEDKEDKDEEKELKDEEKEEDKEDQDEDDQGDDQDDDGTVPDLPDVVPDKVVKIKDDKKDKK